MTVVKGELGTPVRRSRRLSTASLQDSGKINFCHAFFYVEQKIVVSPISSLILADLVLDVNHDVVPKKKKKEKRKVSKSELEVDHVFGALNENGDVEEENMKTNVKSSKKVIQKGCLSTTFSCLTNCFFS